MNEETRREAQRWAVQGAKAVPGVLWTVQLAANRQTPRLHVSYWTREQSGLVNHVGREQAEPAS